MSTADCTLAASPIERLAQRIEAETGLHFAPAKRKELDSAVRKMALAKGFAQDAGCVEWLLAGRWDAEKDELCARYLTIGETYFFREPRAFELVCDYARRRLLAGGKDHPPLRLWSAGCCTGEEPYSMAIRLRQAVPELAPAKLSILATDINQASLAFARAGVYRQWSFRRTAPAVHAQYFSKTADQRFELGAEIRKQVRFAQLNLALPVYPSAATATESIDIIFCRNVLMYFSRRQAKLVIERFRACLVEGGWLVVNPSEASAELFPGFAATYYPDAVYFQKNSASAPAAVRAPGLPAAPAGARRASAAPALRAERPAAAPVEEPRTDLPLAADPAGRAYALARAGEIEAALDCLERALELTPLICELYQAKALIAMENNDHRLAMQSLKRLLYLNPECALAHYLSAVVLAEQGARADALRHLEASRDLLALFADDALVPGSDGWPAASLRASVYARLEAGR
jgi:chemotaxis protein methyltransferase CheR